MRSERDTIKMLRDWAEIFKLHYRNKDYGMANRIYDNALTIIVYMEMGEDVSKEIFGVVDEETGARENGLFNEEMVSQVNWECCIKRHQTYQDVVCRRQGLPLKFYSDEDYCARCDLHKKTDI